MSGAIFISDDLVQTFTEVVVFDEELSNSWQFVLLVATLSCVFPQNQEGAFTWEGHFLFCIQSILQILG